MASHAAPAPAPSTSRPTTTVTLSLPRLIQTLKRQLPADRSVQFDALLVLAADPSPEQQKQIKVQMCAIASPAELTAAVNALMDEGSSDSAVPATAPAAAAPAASQSGLPTPTYSAPPVDLPPATDAEPPLEALFGQLDKEEFRTCLIHAFHCRTPSCPVPGCEAMCQKLERLHTHVSSCSAPGCVLCRMWTYLKYYRDSLEPSPLKTNSSAASSVTQRAKLPRTPQSSASPLLVA